MVHRAVEFREGTSETYGTQTDKQFLFGAAALSVNKEMVQRFLAAVQQELRGQSH